MQYLDFRGKCSLSKDINKSLIAAYESMYKAPRSFTPLDGWTNFHNSHSATCELQFKKCALPHTLFWVNNTYYKTSHL